MERYLVLAEQIRDMQYGEQIVVCVISASRLIPKKLHTGIRTVQIYPFSYLSAAKVGTCRDWSQLYEKL
jgi:hypothetical protein